jgi:hypothetical protein
MFSIEKRSDLKLKPPTMHCDKPIASGIKPPLPNTAFFMAILGQCGSGKTSFAVSLLTDMNAYRAKFDNVELVIPESSLASIGNKAIQKHDKIHYDLNYETLEDIHERAQNATKDGETTLVLIDDFSASLKQNDLQTLFKHMVLARRHLRLSVMMISQTYNAIPLNLRKNINWIVLFKAANKAEYKGVFSELIWMEEKKADSLMTWLYQKPHDFLLLDITNNTFHRNFDRIAFKT